MAKICLTKEEIKELAKLITEVFEYLKLLRQKNRLAEKIQFPKIPAIFSESIIMHLINDSKILSELRIISQAKFGGKKGDILISTSGDELRLEVKATAKSAFEYFGEKDISANYLVWIHFGDYFTTRSGGLIDVYLINEPSRYFDKPVKITLNKLKEKVGNKLQITKVDLKKL